MKLHILGSKLSSKYGSDLEQVESLVFRLGQMVCSTHHIMMEVQQKLLMIYMQAGVMNMPTMCRKIQLCHNILAYLEKTNPDDKSSRKYLGIKRCLVESKLQTMAQEHKEGRLNQNKLARVICEKQALAMMTSRKGEDKKE